jgi:hypothetical protein
MSLKSACVSCKDFRSWVDRAVLCALAAGVCGAIGGINAFLHPIRHPHSKAPNVPALSEQIVSTFTLFALFGLAAAVAALSILQLYRWSHRQSAGVKSSR